MPVRVAILDETKRLVGARTVSKPAKDDIEIGDLVPDGRYYLHPNGAFVPVGFGMGKPKRPPVDRDRATFLALRALMDGKPIPHEVRLWCDWYERHNG